MEFDGADETEKLVLMKISFKGIGGQFLGQGSGGPREPQQPPAAMMPEVLFLLRLQRGWREATMDALAAPRKTGQASSCVLKERWFLH